VVNTIVVASYNADKVAEIRQLLKSLQVRLLSLWDWPDPPELTEPYSTFAQNAAEKALTTARATGHLALADDSGLIVPALAGAPGVHSSRVAPTDAERIEWLLGEMNSLPGDQRQAHFVCVVAVATPSGEVLGTWEGRVNGIITEEPRGDGGFGYDPVFFYPPDDCTFAQMTTERKNSVSHRGQALRALAQDLPGILGRLGSTMDFSSEATE